MKSILLLGIFVPLLSVTSIMSASSNWFDSVSFSSDYRRKITAEKYKQTANKVDPHVITQINVVGIAPNNMGIKLIRGFLEKACEDHKANKGPSSELLKEYFNNLIAIFGDFDKETALKAKIVLELIKVNQVDAAIYLAKQLKKHGDNAFPYCHCMVNSTAFFYNPNLNAFMKWHSFYTESSKSISKNSLFACLQKADAKTKATFKKWLAKGQKRTGFSKEARDYAKGALGENYDSFDISKHQTKAFFIPDWALPIPDKATTSNFFNEAYQRIVEETLDEDRYCGASGSNYLKELSYLEMARLTHEGTSVKKAIKQVHSKMQDLNVKWLFWSKDEAIRKTMVFLIEADNIDGFKAVLDYLSYDYKDNFNQYFWPSVFSALLRYAAVEKSFQVEEECCICLDTPPAVQFACGHMCCCSLCFNELQKSSNECPLCRQPILETVW